ncbi:MAG: hypothetical protein ACPGPE_12730 [Planctomycetota bacterium]
MFPILFEIPLIGVPLRAFGLMVVLGFLVGTHLYGKLGDRYAVDHVRRGRDLPGQRHRTALPR